MKTSVSPGAGGIAEGLAAAGGWQEAGREGGMIPQARLCHNQGERALQPTLPPCWEGRELCGARQGGWGLHRMLREKDEGWGEERRVCLCKDSIFTLLL